MINHLYIVQIDKTGAIKIGRSKHPLKRIKQLQTSCPYKIIPILILENKGHMEKMLHARIAKYKTTQRNEEWFTFDSLSELPSWIYEKFDLDVVNTWWE